MNEKMNDGMDEETNKAMNAMNGMDERTNREINQGCGVCGVLGGVGVKEMNEEMMTVLYKIFPY